jgi:Cu/Ag efflux protein CusF
MRLDSALKVAAIKHGKIGDWMEAMTMEFPVRTQTDFDKLSVGAHIAGTVYVRDLEYSIGDITVEKP